MTSHACFNRNHVRAWGCALALGCLSLIANANTVNRSIGQGLWDAATRGKTTTLGVGEGRMIVIRPPTGAGGGWMNANGTAAAPANWGVKAAPTGGGVRVGSDSTVMVAERAVPVTVVADIAKDVVVSGIAGCATGGIAGCVLGVGVPLAFAYFNLSGTMRVNPTTGQVERNTDPDMSCTNGCFVVSNIGFGPSEASACRAYWAYWAARGDTSSSFTGQIYESTNGARYCTYRASGSTTDAYLSVTWNPNANHQGESSGTWYPATPEYVRDALISSGAPVDPRIVPELEKTGVNWTDISRKYFGPGSEPTPSLSVPQVSGPSSVTGPREVTTTPDGKVTSKQSSTPMGYDGNKVTAGDTTTTTTVTNADGSSGGTTTTVTSSGSEGDKPQEDPPTQCDKYPETLGCAELDTPDGEIPKATKNVTFAPENVFGGGSCPADRTFTSGMTGRSYKAWDFGMTCSYIATYVRPVVLLLATFAAFLILMPGKVET